MSQYAVVGEMPSWVPLSLQVAGGWLPLSTYAISVAAAQLPSDLQIPVEHSEFNWHFRQLPLVAQIGVVPLQSVVWVDGRQATQVPVVESHRGVEVLRARQSPSSAGPVQARHIAALQIGVAVGQSGDVMQAPPIPSPTGMSTDPSVAARHACATRSQTGNSGSVQGRAAPSQ